MGQPRRTKKHYAMPRKPWDSKRIDEESALVKTYGLKNKREIRKIETLLRKKRHGARMLLNLGEEAGRKKQKELIDSLAKIGVLGNNATADDVLGLGIKDFLERRLQVIVWRKNLANTIKQARQIIVHGHIAINGMKVDRPNYLVEKDEEGKVTYFGNKIKLQPKEKPGKGRKELPSEAKALETAEEKKEPLEEIIGEAIEADKEEKEEAEIAEEEKEEEKVEEQVKE